jgi:hypothetical protein
LEARKLQSLQMITTRRKTDQMADLAMILMILRKGRRMLSSGTLTKVFRKQSQQLLPLRNSLYQLRRYL